ncbi:hypothetical protein N9955_00360 [bacterium]|nr:hypothetical protein [bacterium]
MVSASAKSNLQTKLKNMNTREKITAILEYYLVNRQRGHTTAMLKGAGEANAIVLAGNGLQSEMFEKQHKLKSFSINSEFGNKLRGMNRPLVIDNYAMMDLLNQTLSVMNEKDILLSDTRLSLRYQMRLKKEALIHIKKLNEEIEELKALRDKKSLWKKFTSLFS